MSVESVIFLSQTPIFAGVPEVLTPRSMVRTEVDYFRSRSSSLIYIECLFDTMKRYGLVYDEKSHPGSSDTALRIEAADYCHYCQKTKTTPWAIITEPES